MQKVFLMCSERSGSNFISKLLNAHSCICGPAPKHILNPVTRNLYRYEPLNSTKNWSELIKDILNLIDIEFSFWKKKFTYNELFNSVKIGDSLGLINYIFESEAKEHQKEILFIKENKIYEFFPFLLVNYPDAKYIFQVRDPRDVALSWKKNPTHFGGIVAAAKQWKEDQQNSLKNAHLLAQSNNVVIIKYEDLVSKTELILTKILSFLSLNYETEMLDFHKDSLTKKNATMQKAWENLSKKVITDNFDKYINELSEIEIKIIEKICFDEMTHLGYKTKYSSVELSSISSAIIEEYDKEEKQVLTFQLTDGVIKNIEAKKVFYQKNISE